MPLPDGGRGLIPLRRAAIAFSFANLCFVRVWSELLTYTGSDSFFMEGPPSPGQYAGVMGAVSILAVLLFTAATVMRRKRGKIALIGRWVFFVAVLIPLNALREVLSRHFGLLRAELFRVVSPVVVAAVLVLFGIVFLWIVSRWQHQVVYALSTIFLITSPFVPLTFGQAFYKMAHYDPAPFARTRHAPPVSSPKTNPKVVFLLFDEWDYRLTFIDRDPTLVLPEIDRLRRETIFATTAHTPNSSTQISVPAVLTGRPVERSWPGGVAELLLRFENDPHPVSFSHVPNIFTTGRAAGYNIGVIGWYLPYCRMLSSSLTVCEHHEMARQMNSTGSSMWENMVNQTRCLFETSLFSIFGQSLVIKHQAEIYKRALAETEQCLRDPRLGFLYAHFGIPHPPYFYDRRNGEFDLKNSAVTGYLDNVALVDRTIGDLRRQMEGAHEWDSSVVLVTSDHYFRTAGAIDGKHDKRVPFFLKMPHAHEGIEINIPFNTLLIHDLITEILQDRVKTAEDAVHSITAKAALQSENLRNRY